MQLSIFNGKELQVKFTVEEREDGVFIATAWYPDLCLEVDRYVATFETYSGALVHLYDDALKYALERTELKIECGPCLKSPSRARILSAKLLKKL